MALHILRDEVEGVVHVSTGRDLPGPRAAILGAVHGDEECGLRLIRKLEAEARAGTLTLDRGTLTLIHGNPAATAQGRRYTRGGDDLNRLFDFGYESLLSPSQWTAEHFRAVALRPVLQQLDSALDLHSAAAETRPFGIAMGSAGSTELGARIGLEDVATRWDGAGIATQVALVELAKRGCPAVAVECGRHGEAETNAVAERLGRRYLNAAGLVGDTVPVADTRRFHVVSAYRKPAEDFRFVKPLRGLSPLCEGELLGTSSKGDFFAERDGFAVLPNDRVPVGKAALFFAVPA